VVGHGYKERNEQEKEMKPRVIATHQTKDEKNGNCGRVLSF